MQTENEKIRWASVSGYSRYEASDTGLLRSINYKNSGKTVILKPATGKDGYLQTALQKDNGEYTSMKIHKAVILAFSYIPTGKEINHIDGNKKNNYLLNLEVVDRSANITHAYARGLISPKVGSANGMSKLTEEDVRNIREVAASGGRYYGRKELALKYGVSECTIKEVVVRRKNKFYNVS
jgi:hypothetical protein